MEINFISCKVPEENRTIHTKSDNIKIMIGNERDEVTSELFKSVLQRYQEWLEESMKRSNFYLIVLIYYIMNFIWWV